MRGLCFFPIRSTNGESKGISAKPSGSIRRIPIVTLQVNAECPIPEDMKRTVQVNVKMTEEDFKLLRTASEKKWPDAVMTNSGIVLALARIAAKEILGKGKK